MPSHTVSERKKKKRGGSSHGSSHNDKKKKPIQGPPKPIRSVEELDLLMLQGMRGFGGPKPKKKKKP